MDDRTLYEDDIVLWSERQADALRTLRDRRDLPNDLDLNNIIEEIESVGRSQLDAVESFLTQLFIHLAKLAAEPEALAGRHWRAEILNFRKLVMKRLAPSMRRLIDLDGIWRDAIDVARAQAEETLGPRYDRLYDTCAPTLDEIVDRDLPIDELIARVRDR
jgi:hypothetical protein